MGFRITYEGDEQELLGAFLEATVKRSGEGNWLLEFTLDSATPNDGYHEVLDARLNAVDLTTDKVTVGLVDDQDDYEPTGETRVLDLNDIRGVHVQ